MEVCNVCGLPKDICACETIAKESQQIKVYVERKKFGKLSTMVEGIDEKDIDIREVSKKLKSELACGGTVKAGKIELQGDHKAKAKGVLIKLGFPAESISVR